MRPAAICGCVPVRERTREQGSRSPIFQANQAVTSLRHSARYEPADRKAPVTFENMRPKPYAGEFQMGSYE